MSNYWDRNRSDPYRDLLLQFLRSTFAWLTTKVNQEEAVTSIFSVFFPILLTSLHQFMGHTLNAIDKQIESHSLMKKKRINLRLEPSTNMTNDSESDDQDIPTKTDQFIRCGRCQQTGHRNRDCPNPRVKRQRKTNHPGYSTTSTQ